MIETKAPAEKAPAEFAVLNGSSPDPATLAAWYRKSDFYGGA